MKSFAGRGQDWVDVERIIVRQTGKLDWAFAEFTSVFEIDGDFAKLIQSHIATSKVAPA